MRFNGIALALQNLTLHEVWHGQLDQALEHGRRSAEIYQRTGDLRGWGMSNYWVAVVALNRSEYAECIRLAEEMVTAGLEGGDTQVRVWGLGAMALAYSETARIQDAIEALCTTIELAEMIPDYVSVVAQKATLGACYLQAGKPAEALRALEEAEYVSREHQSRIGAVTVTLYTHMAEAHLLAGGLGGGRGREWAGEGPFPLSPRKAALDKATAAARQALRSTKSFLPGLPEALRVRGLCQWLSGHKRAARRSWTRSLREAERMGMRYLAGLTHLEIGLREGDVSELRRAEALFKEIGAAPALAETRDVLRAVGAGAQDVG